MNSRNKYNIYSEDLSTDPWDSVVVALVSPIWALLRWLCELCSCGVLYLSGFTILPLLPLGFLRSKGNNLIKISSLDFLSSYCLAVVFYISSHQLLEETFLMTIMLNTNLRVLFSKVEHLHPLPSSPVSHSSHATLTLVFFFLLPPSSPVSFALLFLRVEHSLICDPSLSSSYQVQ